MIVQGFSGNIFCFVLQSFPSLLLIVSWDSLFRLNIPFLLNVDVIQ